MSLPIVERLRELASFNRAHYPALCAEPEFYGLGDEAGDTIEELVEALNEAICFIPSSQKTALTKFSALITKIIGDAGPSSTPSNNTSVNLKPCPFCGGEAESYVSRTDALVRCERCPADMGVFDTEAEAIAAWNTRYMACHECETPKLNGASTPRDERE
jgi:Lar family restriction alleviation protein